MVKKKFLLVFLALMFLLGAGNNSSKILEKNVEYTGEVEQAKKKFEERIRIDTSNYESYYQLGCIYFRKSKHRKEIKYLNRCLEINPEYGKAYFVLGRIYYDLNQDIRAKQYFEKAKKFLEREKDSENLKIAEDFLKNLSCKSKCIGPSCGD